MAFYRLVVFGLVAAINTRSLAQLPTVDSSHSGHTPETKAPATLKKLFSVEGVYVEACTCTSACAAELSGENPGCNAVGAMRIEKGMYDGKDIAGCAIAFGVKGDSVHLYVDAPESKRAAAEAFARASMAGLGVIKAVTPAKIELEGKDGAYTVRVDSGKVLSLSTVPVMGGDHKTPGSSRTLSTRSIRFCFRVTRVRRHSRRAKTVSRSRRAATRSSTPR